MSLGGFLLGDFGRLLMILGLLLVIIGAILFMTNNIPFIGRLPGDIVIRKKSFTLYIPIATSLLLSIVLSLIFMLLRKR